MSRRATQATASPLTDPHSLTAYLHRFLEWSGVHNYAATTIIKRRESIKAFIRWCEERGLDTPQMITKPILERYQRHLYYHRKTDGQPLSSRSQRSRLTPIRAYFKWLAQQNYILYNPASDIELPRVEKRLPKAVLTEKEVATVMAQADIHEPLGLRDRAMMEVLYSTGIRRMELAGLKLHAIDQERGAMMVWQGKGKKDRVIPIGDRAIAWVNRYLLTVRPTLSTGLDDGTLFLSRLGEAFTPSALSDCIRVYVQKAAIGKQGSCHLFRHAMATQMLENGADIRFIQAMLGHADLSTTQVYTQVSIRQLKAIHTATHPARLGRQAPQAGPIEPDYVDLLQTLAGEEESTDETG